MLGQVTVVLRRLDRRLRSALDLAAADARSTGDPAFRGLYLEAADAEEALARRPLGPALDLGPPEEHLVEPGDGKAWVEIAGLGLSRLDLDVLAVSLAPELDPRYERLYAYLADDVTRRRPTVALTLDLVCGSGPDRFAGRGRFAPDAPLVRERVVRLVSDSEHPDSPLPTCLVRPDEQVVAHVLGLDVADPRVAGFCTVEDAALPTPLNPELARAAHRLLAVDTGAPPRVLLWGTPGSGRRRSAARLAARLGRRLGTIDVPTLLGRGGDPADLLAVALRECRWRGALPVLIDADALLTDSTASHRRAGRVLADWRDGLVLTARRAPTRPLVPGETAVAVAPLGPGDAHRAWVHALGSAGATDADVAAVASRFRLAPGQVERAAAVAVDAAGERGAFGESIVPSKDDLVAAARGQSGADLPEVVRTLPPRRGWNTAVLPGDTLAQLREIAERLAHAGPVLEQWGFGDRVGPGGGITALFTGPSGSGKTMAAGLLAGELGLDLYSVDLSAVVSKYIGETEKNLARVFDAAENANAILFFDEADALFGRRSEVRDSHDRYANLETAYLLQRMERYGGLAVLATNLRGHLDEAFLRRLTFTVYFPFPDEEARRRIWSGIWPTAAPLGDDVDLDTLAREARLTGGNIRNVAVAAAFLAAADGGTIGMAHLRRALGRERQKLGLPAVPDDVGSTR